MNEASNELLGEPWTAEAASRIAKVVEIGNCRYGPMLAFTDDTVITRSLQTYGEWSEHEIGILSKYILDDTLVLDVGANIGTHSLAFARRRPRALVWGFEPQPLVSSLAWTNCARNDARNVTILQIACGDEPGEIVLGPPLATELNVGAFSLVQPATGFAEPETSNNQGSASGALAKLNRLCQAWLSRTGIHRSDKRDNASLDPTPPLLRVRVAPLDSLRFPLPVSLVKIDVEGMEPAVLSGARRLLARDRPVVFFETLSVEKLAAPFALLKRLDYRLFWMETHQFNHANFRQSVQNLWWRTEIGVLALQRNIVPHEALPEVDNVPSCLPYREDARSGVLNLPFSAQLPHHP